MYTSLICAYYIVSACTATFTINSKVGQNEALFMKLEWINNNFGQVVYTFNLRGEGIHFNLVL